MATSKSYEDFLHIASDDLETGQCIGRGGFGVVFCGNWISRDFTVAIKVFSVNAFQIEARKQEIVQELSVMNSIRFDHVLNVYGACLEPKYCALVVEYMPLGSLHDVLQKDDIVLSWLDRWSIICQMTKGINFLHQLRPVPIIHRDIKSFNFLMKWGQQYDSNRFIVKVGDFGLAKFRSEANTESSNDGMVGTILWKAPELFDSESKHSKASDVFALGVCFWEVSTRCLPYDGMTVKDLLLQVVMFGRRLSIPSNIPKDLKEIIQDSWAQDPNERPTCRVLLDRINSGMQSALASDFR